MRPDKMLHGDPDSFVIYKHASEDLTCDAYLSVCHDLSQTQRQVRHAVKYDRVPAHMYACMHVCMISMYDLYGLYVFCMYLCMFACTYCLYVCVYVCMYVRIYACVYACRHACMFVQL